MTESSVTIVASFCTVTEKNHHCTTGLVGVGHVGTRFYRIYTIRRVMLSARNKEGKGPHTMCDGATEEPECDSISTRNFIPRVPIWEYHARKPNRAAPLARIVLEAGSRSRSLCES